MPKYSNIQIRDASRGTSIATRGLGTILLALAVWFGSWQAARADLQLVMMEEAGCIWCARWNAEVAPEYPITPEGLAAPLRRIDINQPVPEDLALNGRAIYTPTFILVSDGVEIGRIEGYPGEDFFWGLLGRLLEDAAIGTN